MATTVAEVQVALGLVGTDTVVGGLREVDQGLAQVAKTGAGASIDADRLFGGLDKIGTGMLVAGGAGAAAFGLAIHAAADLEHTIAGVGAVSGATAPQLQQLSRLAVQLGQDTTLSGVGASDAAKAMEELAKGGVSVSDIMGGAARGALLLASAGSLDVAQAATIAADAMNQFGLSGKDVPHIADLLAAAANSSSLEVSDLALSLKYLGPVAHSMGLSIEETVGALAELGAAGIKADTAGTSLRTMMVNLANPTKAMRKIIEEYGLSFFDASGHMKSLADIAGELHGKLGGLTDQQRLQALETLFGKEALAGAIVVYNGGAEAVHHWTDEVNKAGSAAEVGSARNKNLEGSWTQLKDSAETLAITVGQRLIPPLTELVNHAITLVNRFQDLSPATQDIIVKVGLGATGFLLLGGAIIKTTSYVRDLTGAVGDVIGAFGKKEAAKKSLTAANELLAGSAKGTGAAMAGEGGAAAAAGAAILDVAAITVVAGAAAVGLVYGVSKAADALDQGGNRAKDNAQAWTAASFAIAHGGTEANGAVDAFTRLTVAAGVQAGDVGRMSVLWNQYVASLQAGGQSTDTLGLKLIDLQQFVRIASDRLGEGAITGETFNRSIGLLNVGAGSASATLPALAGGLGTATTAFGAAVTAADDYNRALADAEMQGIVTTRALDLTATGAIAAASAFADLRAPATTTALGLQDINIYGNGAQTALNDDANAAMAAAMAFDTASAAIAGYQKAGSQLKGEKDTLQTEFDELVKKRDGSQLSDADAKRLADAKAQLADLNTKAGGGGLTATQQQRMTDLQNEIAALEKLGTTRKLTAAEAKKLADDEAALADLQNKAGPGKLSAADQQRRTDLMAEIAALEAKVKAGVPLTPAEQARLDVIAGQINWLNGQIGVNQTNTRTATSAAVTAQQQAQGAATTAAQANTTANAAQAAAAAGRGLAIQAPPPTTTATSGLFSTLPIDTSKVSGYDEFGQPYAGTKTAGGAAPPPANITIPVTITNYGPTAPEIVERIRQQVVDGVYGALQGALGGPGGGGAPAGLMP